MAFTPPYASLDFGFDLSLKSSLVVVLYVNCVNFLLVFSLVTTTFYCPLSSLFSIFFTSPFGSLAIANQSNNRPPLIYYYVQYQVFKLFLIICVVAPFPQLTNHLPTLTWLQPATHILSPRSTTTTTTTKNPHSISTRSIPSPSTSCVSSIVLK